MTAMLTSSFTTRHAPWARVGTEIHASDVNAATAARLGGIDFDVELRPLAYRVTDATGHDSWCDAPSRRAVVRADTDELFGVVSSERYQLVQYRDAFTFMDGINPRYVAAGALNGGRQGFMVAQLPELTSLDPAPDGNSDPHDLFVVLRTSHDCTKAVEIAILPLRTRCMNQLGLPSLTRDAPQRWSIKHVGNVQGKLGQAQTVLARAERYADAFTTRVQQLASVPVDGERLRLTLRRVLPDRPRRDEQIRAIESAFTSSPHVGFAGTGWGAVNAVSEYFEWQRDSGVRTDQSRFTSGLAGATQTYVNRTAQLLITSM